MEITQAITIVVLGGVLLFRVYNVGYKRGARDATRTHLQRTDTMLARWRMEQRP